MRHVRCRLPLHPLRKRLGKGRGSGRESASLAGVAVIRSYWSWLRQSSCTFHKSSQRLTEAGCDFLKAVSLSSTHPVPADFPSSHLSSTQTTGPLTLPIACLASSRPAENLSTSYPGTFRPLPKTESTRQGSALDRNERRKR